MRGPAGRTHEPQPRGRDGETPALLGGAASVLETGASAPKSLAVRRGRHDRELSSGRFPWVIPSW